MWKETFHGGICHAEKNISVEGGAGFSSIILKNNEQINMKKFFQLKARSSIKT